MIETTRLYLQPLTYEQLLKYVCNDDSLEKELRLIPTARTISIDLKEALEQTILPNVADKTKNYLFSTLWVIIHKEYSKIVGSLCFFGEPNSAGEVEVGYGINDEFQRNGFMTEAISGIIIWVKKQQQIRAIIAATEKNNIASYSVLLKNNFVKIKDDEELLHWRLEGI
jgi:[ribosomal protein S5]-alanine N-acetyltransferase